MRRRPHLQTMFAIDQSHDCRDVRPTWRRHGVSVWHPDEHPRELFCVNAVQIGRCCVARRPMHDDVRPSLWGELGTWIVFNGLTGRLLLANVRCLAWAVGQAHELADLPHIQLDTHLRMIRFARSPVCRLCELTQPWIAPRQ